VRIGIFFKKVVLPFSRSRDYPTVQPYFTNVPNEKQTIFLAAYADCHDAFLRYCTTVAFGKCDVRDLVQDVMVSTFQHFDGIEAGKLLNYMIRAARNRTDTGRQL
jgi:hypothetical protein